MVENLFLTALNYNMSSLKMQNNCQEHEYLIRLA